MPCLPVSRAEAAFQVEERGSTADAHGKANGKGKVTAREIKRRVGLSMVIATATVVVVT